MYALEAGTTTIQSTPRPMTANRDEVLDRLRQRLMPVNAAGWGYYTGKASRVEPTCWALLAHGSTDSLSTTDWEAFARPHLAFLTGLQGSDGLLVETDPALANLTANGLAAIVCAGQRRLISTATFARLHAGLVNLKGVRLEQIDPKQDSTLQGWPWVRDTFSWVEPTAWCLLATKVAGVDVRSQATGARQAEAERLLTNRMCTGGGWNYGNAVALGQDLRAYVPTTAVALMSLQDRRGDPAVQESLRMLESQRLAEPSAMTLALVSICLRLYGVSTDAVDERLTDVVARSEASGNLQAVAMAMYALSAQRHQGGAFRVSQ